MLAQAKEQVREVTVPIVASDRDAGAVAATIENAERAGVDKVIRCEAASISDLAPPEAEFGWLITNPPYGGRIQGGDLRNLYARFGDVLRDRLPGWRIGMLSPFSRNSSGSTADSLVA